MYKAPPILSNKHNNPPTPYPLPQITHHDHDLPKKNKKEATPAPSSHLLSRPAARCAKFLWRQRSSAAYPAGAWILGWDSAGVSSEDHDVVSSIRRHTPGTHLHSPPPLQWVISAYALTFGGFLLLTGRLGDVYGHRNFFIIGLLWFTIFAVVAGYSTSSTMMIFARGLQGIGAASTIPNAVALILQNYKPGRSRNQAMSFFASTGAIGFVVGLIVGGVVTQSSLGWRWIFYISAMVSGLMAVLSVLVIPSKSEDDDNDEPQPISTEKKTIDILGASLSTASMLLLVYVLTDGNTTGWSNPRIISLLVVSVLLMAAFIVVEFKIRQPLMPLWIWKLPNFAPAFVIACCLVGFFQGYLYFITLIFQEVFNYTPLDSAIHYLPLGIIASIMGVTSEKIIHRFNIKVALIAGLALGTVGNVLIGFYNTEDQYWSIAFPSFVIGVTGLSSVYASVSIAAIGMIQFKYFVHLTAVILI
ncbi:major facilitator superfamily-domain-containing protein [Jimgerdemannia flammicorona]|uniref:Major facilitator superfamily-domain-containing protein n=1 Tax=Jimgerdemannia flammicorona TaxID=994334 RepID=A0A433QRA4_9FUNG|nr:major facilitator superfamily-domain-containing protein [Jimgerdemannia flammicorona]